MPTSGSDAAPAPVTLVVDVANVVGSRPDGWWRDRVGATSRFLARLAPLVGEQADGPDGGSLRIVDVEAVVEGRAAAVDDPGVAGLSVVRAADDGDTTIAERSERLVASGVPTVVVTADRGLRDRLPPGCRVAGPGWLLDCLDHRA